MQPRYRRILTVIIVLITIIVIVAIIVKVIASYTDTLQKVTLTFDGNYVSKLELYKGYNTRNVPEKTGSVIQTIESDKEYTLKKGVYVLQPSGEHLDTSLIELTVGDSVVKKTIDVDYAASYLAQLYESDKDTLSAIVSDANPKIAGLYVINQGRLYHHGEWFGTTLSYTGTQSLLRDTLRLVAKKENGTWKVVTKPQITLSTVEYPDVPKSVLEAVNDIDLGVPTIVNSQPSTATGHAD